MMKKISALILLILIVCLAACGADADTESTTTEPTTAETTTAATPAHDFSGLYVFTADASNAAALGEAYSWFPEYGVEFALVLTLDEQGNAVLDLRISSVEEIEAALFDKANRESAEAYGMSYEDYYAMLLTEMGSEEAIRENFRHTHTGALPDIQSKLIDIFPLSGAYRADGESVTVTLGGSEMTFVLDGESLVTEQNSCAMTFLRQG